MHLTENQITVYEHESLRTDRGEKRLSPDQLAALQRFHGTEGVPYYSLIYNGVKFGEYVGVIQVGRTIIEVLPKADRLEGETAWRSLLISMLHAAGILDSAAPSSSGLSLHPNSILDLYFELFVKEIEHLLHQGLIKKYRRNEGNKTALTGSLHFAKHITQNLVHHERFYVKYSTYDKKHDIHAILYKAIKLLGYINTSPQLSSRIGVLKLDFPELSDIRVTEALFKRIVFNRKTKPYENALRIAYLILLNYHPDLKRGTHNVLALMFNMNTLWERFVYASLYKHKSSGISMVAQKKKFFWKPDSGNLSRMKADIVLNQGTENCIVLDTKWKNLKNKNPSPEDLRQMFVYMKYYQAKKVALVYPGSENRIQSGRYFRHNNINSEDIGDEECSVISIGVDGEIKKWQESICENIENWMR